MIPESVVKQFTNEFVTEIMQKLKVPDDEWQIHYTTELHHPTAYVSMGALGIDWRYRNMNEAIHYGYQKKLIENKIFVIPKSIRLNQVGQKTELETDIAGVVTEWDGIEIKKWIMYYLFVRENTDFWMSSNKGDGKGYLINKIIKYNGIYYNIVLNTEMATNMWCNIYRPGYGDWLIEYFDKDFRFSLGEPTVPIVITPFGEKNYSKGKFMNWENLSWSDLK